MGMYKVTKKDGSTLYNHDNRGIVYKEGMEIEELEFDDDEMTECGRGIYACTAEQLPLWWRDFDTAIWEVEKTSKECVEVGKGARYQSMTIGKKLTEKKVEELGKKYGFNWLDRSQITKKNNSTQTAGYESTQKAVYGSTQTAGDKSTQKAGHMSTQKAGDESTQTAGDWSTQKAGDKSTQKAGYKSTQRAGCESTQKAGDKSTQIAGDESTQTSGENSIQTAGHNSIQKAGYESTQTAGGGSTQIAGNNSIQTAGINSVQIGYWYEQGKYKTACRVVTEKEADKPYKFKSGEWVSLESEEG